MSEQTTENTKRVFTQDSKVGKITGASQAVPSNGGTQSGGNTEVGNTVNVPQKGLQEPAVQGMQNVSNAAKSNPNEVGGKKLDGSQHVEPKRGAENVQADSHVRRLFPSLSPEYVDVMSKSIGLAFDRRTFERSANSTYFHARSPQYSTKNGEKLLIKQTISELLEQLREKFSTAEFKAFLDGKKTFLQHRRR